MLADHALDSQYTPSGTLNCIGLLWGSNFYWPLRALQIRQRDQYKPNRHRLVQRKWVITRNMHISPKRRSTTNTCKYLGLLRADRAQHHYQMYLGLLQKGARSTNQNRKITKYKTDIPGTPLATQLAITHADLNPQPIPTFQFRQQEGEHEHTSKGSQGKQKPQ